MVYTVERGDDLWSLAERYYGRGLDWRRIAAANPSLLTGGPDRLEVGWRLQIPGVKAAEPADEDEDEVTVRRGDTLSALAERELGDADRWPELYRANRALLADPDVLATGTRLELPDAAAADASATTAAAPAPRAKPPAPPQEAEQPAEPEPVQPVEPVRPPPPPQQDGATRPPLPVPPEPVGQAAQAEPAVSADAVLPLGAVGGLLAAGLVAGLAVRRRRQLAVRPLGRRIAQPAPDTVLFEAALGRRQRPLGLRALDQALRTVAAGARAETLPLPRLQLVLLADDRIELQLAEPAPAAPVGFDVRGSSWVLDRTGADYLAAVPPADEALRPWPTLVTLGRDDGDALVLADLEAVRLLELAGDDDRARAVLAALATELSFSPWAEEMTLTLLGPDARLPAALGVHSVDQTDDADALLDRLDRRATEQRRHQPHPVLGQHRLDPDLAEPWAPEIVLVDQALTAEQRDRLRALVCDAPQVPLAAVVVGEVGAPWRLRLDGRDGPARLEPAGLLLTPQTLAPAEYDVVLELVAATGSTETTPAPWWPEEVVEPEPPPDNVTYLGRRFGGWSAGTSEEDEVAAIAAAAALSAGTPSQPTLLLLGPVELVGATGPVPPRAAKQCLEYCGWLLEHPGTTARSMASALAVAEGTRRSNVSRLRSWLGVDASGEAYLPDAYTGRIALHAAVSSDWQRVQILTATGVQRASTDALRAVLSLLRGAPLADAAPGQWHWAEELRTDMISCLRDVGVELTRRALDDGDLALARWAAARALVAAPGDELLLAARIRTEHRAGNHEETERLTLQLAAQARRLGVDLDPATVGLLQEVVEGRVRAQFA